MSSTTLAPAGHFFGWIDPNGTVREFDGITGQPTKAVIGYWKHLELSKRHCFFVQTAAQQFAAALDWDPIGQDGTKGSVALFRVDSASRARPRPVRN